MLKNCSLNLIEIFCKKNGFLNVKNCSNNKCIAIKIIKINDVRHLDNCITID